MVKIMQTSAIKVYFQIAECSLLMQKYKLNLRNSLPFGRIFSGRGAILLHIVFYNRLNPRSMV